MTPEQDNEYSRGYSDAAVIARELGMTTAHRWMHSLIASATDATAPYLLGVSDLIADLGDNGARSEQSGAD
jgi:hypothetical protein